MRKFIAIFATLAMLCAVLTPALAEGTIKRIGTLQMLNMSEQEYAAVQKLRAVAGEMLNEESIPAESPYYDGMLDENPEIIYYDSLNDMVMALDANQIDAIDLNRSTAEYLCTLNDNLKILMDYSDAEDNVLTDFVFNSLLSFDFSLMLPEGNQALADELSEALIAMEEDGTLDELAATYIDDVNGEVPAAEPASIDGAETLRVAVTGDLPPMDFVSADGEPAGYNVAVLSEVGRRIARNIEFVPISASARAMALSSGEVDVVFWSRSCMAAQEIIENGMDWTALFEPEDEADRAMMEKIDKTLVSAFDYVNYNTKDVPRGLVVTARYYSDNIVLVAKK